MLTIFQDYILNLTKSKKILRTQHVQDLWSGYGKILRLNLAGGIHNTVVVKLMQSDGTKSHPRGWNTTISHARKLRSYQVENEWYQVFAEQSKARLPQCYGFFKEGDKSLLVLEDLDATGFPIRRQQVNQIQFKNCIAWLANFHASFMGVKPDGLWQTGTYWHLETRPDELNALTDLALKKAALKIDAQLNSCEYQTLVHGDAKLANFCFGANHEVAGLDFQYVGGGCGMKDLAYFVGSCLDEQACEQQERFILDFYFAELRKALNQDSSAVESEWRPLYRVAWADFYRFLKGWSPDHWKINSYSERVTQKVMQQLS